QLHPGAGLVSMEFPQSPRMMIRRTQSLDESTYRTSFSINLKIEQSTKPREVNICANHCEKVQEAKRPFYAATVLPWIQVIIWQVDHQTRKQSLPPQRNEYQSLTWSSNQQA
ncbi:MAG: hypothetical protein ACPHL6_00355, partial [Rubripirellula sp.]